MNSHRRAPGSDGPRPRGAKADPSWEKSADWYDKIIGAQGLRSFTNASSFPARCGCWRLGNGKDSRPGLWQGCFARTLVESGCEVTGVDGLPPSLISKSPAAIPVRASLRYLVSGCAPSCVIWVLLTRSPAFSPLQNMAHLTMKVCRRQFRGFAKRRPAPSEVMNHPVFPASPRQTSWGFDEKVQ